MPMLEAKVVWSTDELEALGVEILLSTGTKVIYSIEKKAFCIIYPDVSSVASNITPISFKQKFSQIFRLEVQQGLEKAREEIYDVDEETRKEVAFWLALAEEQCGPSGFN
jgi:hypothetical protein